MKKILTTVVGFAFALGAFADGQALPTGTSFESDTPGPITTVSEFADSDYWGAVEFEAGQGLAVTNYAAGEIYAGNRPEIAPEAASDDTKYLWINTTFTNGVARNVFTNGTAAAELPTIGDGFYFDSLVKLTPSDDEKPVTAEDNSVKLKVWAKESDESGTLSTNLYVSAGYVDEYGQVTEHDYECCAIDDAWHRITIQAINIAATGTKVGLVVYLDGYPLRSNDSRGSALSWWGDANLNNVGKYYKQTKALFPAIDQTSSDASRFSGVTFAGKGGVDDITFTRTAPAFVDSGDVFVLNYDDHITGFTYQFDSETPVVVSGLSAAGSVSIPFDTGAQHTVVVSSVTYAAGFTNDVWSVDDAESVELSGTTFTLLATASSCAGFMTSVSSAEYVWIGDNHYPTLARAITALNGMPAGDYTLRIDGAATADALTLNIAAGEGVISAGNVTIDLNGKTITGTGTSVSRNATIYSEAYSLTIIDSDSQKRGSIVAPVGAAALKVYYCETSIEAGIFVGEVDLSDVDPFDEGLTAVVSGGKFSYADNTNAGAFALADCLAVGSAAEKDDESDPQYWVITAQQTYTVTFINGEITYDSQDVVEGDVAVAPDAPSKLGYDFLGWFAPGSETAFDFETPITADLTLTSRWDLVEWSITYYDDNDEVFAEETYTIESRATQPLNAGVRSGYSFIEWQDGNGVAVTSLAECDGDLELYGEWVQDATYNVVIPEISNTTVAVYTNGAPEAVYTEPGTYPFAEGLDVTVTYTADPNYSIGGASSWSTNITSIATDVTIDSGDVPAPVLATYTARFIDGATTNDVAVVYGNTVAAGDVPAITPETGYNKVWSPVPAETAIVADTVFTVAKTAKSYTIVTYTNGVEYVQVPYTYNGEDPVLTDPVYDLGTQSWDGKWYTNTNYEAQFAFDADGAATQYAYAQITTSGGSEIVEEIEEAKSGDTIDVSGKVVVVDNDKHEVRVDGETAHIDPWYVATLTGDTLVIEITDDPALNGAAIEATLSQPALSFDVSGNMVISVPNTIGVLRYAVDYSSTPGFESFSTTEFTVGSEVGGTLTAPPAASGEEQFYRIRVAD